MPVVSISALITPSQKSFSGLQTYTRLCIKQTPQDEEAELLQAIVEKTDTARFTTGLASYDTCGNGHPTHM